jgi:GNAT superfamily N-acetyltransferase
MTAMDAVDVSIRPPVTNAEFALAASLVWRCIEGVDRAGVRGWFSPAYAQQPATAFALAFAGTRVVGALMSRSDESFVRALGVAERHQFSLLQYVAVDSAWRRRGIGVGLVAAAEETLRASGVALWIGGAENETAATFFGRCGFTVLPPDRPLVLRTLAAPALRSNRAGYRWFVQEW